MFQVINGITNMTVGTHALSLERVLKLSHSVSYMQHSFVFAFAENNIFATPLSRLMAPFHASLWISILLLLIIAILVILLTKQLTEFQRHFIIGGRMNRTPITNMLTSLIGNNIANRSISTINFSTFARTLTLLWIFFSLIVRNAYQGSLYEYFQNQRIESPFDTVEKVRDSNVTIHLMKPATIFIPDTFDKRR